MTCDRDHLESSWKREQTYSQFLVEMHDDK